METAPIDIIRRSCSAHAKVDRMAVMTVQSSNLQNGFCVPSGPGAVHDRRSRLHHRGISFGLRLPVRREHKH